MNKEVTVPIRSGFNSKEWLEMKTIIIKPRKKADKQLQSSVCLSENVMCKALQLLTELCHLLVLLFYRDVMSI